VLAALGGACVRTQPATDTLNPGVPGGPTAPTPAIAYTDLEPMFATDCLQCHNDAGRSAGNYAMSTYSEVLKDARPGDAASPLVVTTQPGGSMYQYFTGDQQQAKAALIFNWVVVYNAQQSR
jgi:hypothetical protein